MSLKTRLDGRSEDNDRFQIKDEKGLVLAEIQLTDNTSVTLNIVTQTGFYIAKPNGWDSK